MDYKDVKAMWRERWLEAYRLHTEEKMSYMNLARKYGISYPTAYDIVKKGKKAYQQEAQGRQS